MATYEIYLRNNDLTLAGIIDDFSKLELVSRFNAAGKWKFSGFGSIPVGKGQGIIVKRNGVNIFSGVVRSRKKKMEAKGGYVVRTWEVSGIDDLGLLAERLLVPNPNTMVFTSDAYDTRSGNAETVILDYIRFNCGVDAAPFRVMPGLKVQASQNRGSTITGKARFYNALEYAAQLAEIGGGLGIRVRNDEQDKVLVCEIYQTVDRSKSVMFSTDFGNLASFSYTESAPTGNYIYCLGQGEGANRAVETAKNDASILSWGLIEFAKDQRNEADSSSLKKWAQQALDENDERHGFSIVPIEDGQLGFQYEVDYQLGDLVTVADDSDILVDIVREVKIEIDQNKNEKFAPVIGREYAGASPLGSTFERIDNIEKRVEKMEVDL